MQYIIINLKIFWGCEVDCSYKVQCSTWMYQTVAFYRNFVERCSAVLQRDFTGLACWWNLSSNQAWTLVTKGIKIQLIIFKLSRRRKLMTVRYKVAGDEKSLRLEKAGEWQWVCKGHDCRQKLFLPQQSVALASILQW